MYPLVTICCVLSYISLVLFIQQKTEEKQALLPCHNIFSLTWLIFNQLYPLIVMPPSIDVVLKEAWECPAEAQGLIPLIC